MPDDTSPDDAALDGALLDDVVLDDDVRAYLAEVEAAAEPPDWTLPIETVRERGRAVYAALPKTPVGEVEEIEIPGPAGPIPARVYRPAATGPHGTVVMLHGGGFALGDLETHDEAARRTCAWADALVVSVDYRLAPEHPFPAAVDDAVAATRWTAERAGDLGGDPDRLIVTGDSAGGNLAAVVALRFRDAGGPPLAGQGLVYPVTDMRTNDRWPSKRTAANGFGLTQEAMDWFGRLYLSDPAHAAHPDASPIVASDLSGLPPAFVLTAEFDPLRDEGDAYARRLAEAGVEVQHHTLPGTIHGVLTNPVRLRSGDQAWRLLIAWMRSRLSD
ncbi:MAG: alpha/beta hydrolase [Trueperaceae bacterium]|nr:alpha/beta hydrolase [Trueperaceae bacterium]